MTMPPDHLPQWYIDYCERAHDKWDLDDEQAESVVSGFGDAPFLSSRKPDDNRVTNLLRDVAFNRHSMNDGQHVSPADNGRLQVGTDGIEVRLVQGIDEASFKRTLDMATRATIGMDLSQPLPGDWEPCKAFADYVADRRLEGLEQYADDKFCGVHNSHKQQWRATGNVYEGQVAGGEWEEMLKGGLQTALESQVIVFAVSGVSRTCTHQIVRSRRAAFHQQSQRASFMGVAPEVRMPESVWRKPRARQAFLDAYAAAQEAYRVACEEDVSYQDARFVLPEGTTNFILCEYNVKEFRDVYAYRGCSMFSWEIVHVFREMRRLLVEAHPFLADSIKISCEKTSGAKDMWPAGSESRPTLAAAHTCTFQGWERVEGQCDFPWARDTNRTFRSKTYEIGRKPVEGYAGHAEQERQMGAGEVVDPKPVEFVDVSGLLMTDSAAREAAKTKLLTYRPGNLGAPGKYERAAADGPVEIPMPGVVCPSCGSPDPAKHPALQPDGGEVYKICPDPFHGEHAPGPDHPAAKAIAARPSTEDVDFTEPDEDK